MEIKENLLSLIPLISPVLLYLYALNAHRSSKKVPGAELISSLGILVALMSTILVYKFGTIHSNLLGWNGLGFSTKIDALSVSFLLMISLLGFVILKFSKNYMDGDPRRNVFFSRLSTTIASVELLVLSGNLFQILFFWIVTSICLHYLLVFYRNRPQAVAAARKKFIVARLGDFSLLASLILIYNEIGTGDLTTLLAAVGEMESLNSPLIWSTVFIVIAAVLKSAQFPTHGWLIEVVETPTPVSALLHAGLLNAGPFLMVRLGHLMIDSTPASVMLITIGGITALFASVVYLTQPSIKVALGYSSVAHMGFSLFICGLGLYSAAILHVVAHSFYKAHSFLSSGSVVDSLRSRKLKLENRKGNPLAIGLSIFIAGSIFTLTGHLLNIDLTNEFSMIAIGTIIVLGLSILLSNVIDSKFDISAIIVSTVLAFGVALSFFVFESSIVYLLQSVLPEKHVSSILIKIVTSIILSCYTVVVCIQLFAPRLKNRPTGYKMGIHLRNGLYANVIFDRLIGSLKHEKFKWVNLEVKEDLSYEPHVGQVAVSN